VGSYFPKFRKSWSSRTIRLIKWKVHQEEGAAAGLTRPGGPDPPRPRWPGWGWGWDWGRWRRRRLRGAAVAASGGGGGRWGQAAASCLARSPAPDRRSVQRVQLCPAQPRPLPPPPPEADSLSPLSKPGLRTSRQSEPCAACAPHVANRAASGAGLDGQVRGGGPLGAWSSPGSGRKPGIRF
jgi:hypothetical protein